VFVTDTLVLLKSSRSVIVCLYPL